LNPREIIENWENFKFYYKLLQEVKNQRSETDFLHKFLKKNLNTNFQNLESFYEETNSFSRITIHKSNFNLLVFLNKLIQRKIKKEIRKRIQHYDVNNETRKIQ
jgi:DNA primase